MIFKFLGTLGSRLLVMLLTMVIVLMNSRLLGAEGQGTAALIQLGILIIVSISNFLGGGAVVFLTPRVAPGKLVIPAYIWAICSAVLAYGVFSIFPVVPNDYILEISLLGALQSLFSFHLMILLGKEKITSYNVVITSQVLILVVALAYFYSENTANIGFFIDALFVSFSCTFAIALLLSFKLIYKTISFDKIVLYELWKYGKSTQMGNVIQMLNYRLNFILLEYFGGGRTAVGVYSIGLYGSEAIWNVSKSLATIQYSKIANTTEEKANQTLTLAFFHITFVLTLFLAAIAMAVSDATYQWIFGEEMIGIQSLLMILAPGIVANACSGILSHFFSGTGRPELNLKASAISLLALLASGLTFIPQFGIKGAALAAAITYITQCLVLIYFFVRSEKVELKSMLPSKQSWQVIKALSKKY